MQNCFPAHDEPGSDLKQPLSMQESEYTTDGRDSHPSPAGTSRSDVSPQQLTAGRFLMHSVCHEPLVHKYMHS